LMFVKTIEELKERNSIDPHSTKVSIWFVFKCHGCSQHRSFLSNDTNFRRVIMKIMKITRTDKCGTLIW
jgi:hypothetical protein